jgi:Protein of unknown function (DUF2934)
MNEKPTWQEHEAAIRTRAHEHWEKEGRPDSRHSEHWLKAEEELGQLDAQTKGADAAGGDAAAKSALAGQDAVVESRRSEEADKARPYGKELLRHQKE